MDEVIYHGGCVDGFTAAYVYWLEHRNATFHAGSYEKPLPQLTPGSDVIFVDFSCHREDMVKIAEAANSVLVLDHHRTAKEHLTDLPEDVTVVFDMERSGAGITWDYLYPDRQRPALVNYVEDNDLWNHALPYWEEVSTFLKSREKDFEAWMQLDFLMTHKLPRVVELGGAMLQRQNAIVDEIVSTAREVEIAGYHVLMVNSPYSLGSEIAGRLAEGKPFGAYCIDRPDGRSIGLRSREGGVDVGRVAEQLGGGGHPKAAAFRVERDSEMGRL